MVKFVKDSYNNPAVVIAEDEYRYSIVQLAGSDFGRRTSIAKKFTTEIEPTEWALGKAAELKLV